jgi:hypothetical protein
VAFGEVDCEDWGCRPCGPCGPWIIRKTRSQGKMAKGSGVKKPPKRQVEVSPEEEKKNRLRLVVAQIKAENTDPKLIIEVNSIKIL